MTAGAVNGENSERPGHENRSSIEPGFVLFGTNSGWCPTRTRPSPPSPRRDNRCPTGDHAHTPGVTEIQRVTCIGSSGLFTLTFRDGTTSELDPATTSAADLEAALEGTPW